MHIERNPKLPISRPGIYAGIPLETYHSRNICNSLSVSSSGLRTAWIKSLAHFFEGWECNPAHSEDREETRWMRLGSAAHHLLLGEAEFSTRFICRPAELPDERGVTVPWHGNRKVCKLWLQKQEKAGRTVLTPDDIEAIKGMARKLAAHPFAAEALSGLVEHSMFAKDKETGLWLRSRPDSIPSESGDYVDLKITSDVSTIAILSSLRRYGYHQQAALTWEVAEALELPINSFSLIFIESAPPHCVRVVTFKDDTLSRGRRQNRAMLRKIAECTKTGEWPGPGEEDGEFISLPEGEATYIDARLEALEQETAA